MSACPSCGFENDATRKFCQNCGSRLEVAAAAVSDSKPQPHRYTDRSVQAPKRQRSLFLSLIFALTREVVWVGVIAAIAAALLLALMAPDGLPTAAAARPALASMLAADVQAASENAYPRALEIPQADANNFLASRVQTAGEGGGFLSARFQRAYVVIGSGNLTFGVEQNLRGLPVFLQLSCVPKSSANGVTLEVTKGSIGRLQVPAWALPYFLKSFAPVLGSLDQPLRWMSTAGEVVLAPALATIRWPGKEANPTP